jgi:hypothetical protein
MIKKLFIISGIIPATFLTYLSIIGFFLIIPDIFKQWDWFKFLFCFACLLGFGGYFGLWISLLESPKKNKDLPKLILLLGGVLSVIFILCNKQDLALNLSAKPEDFARLIMFLWPFIISSILIVMTLIENKKSNVKT